MKRCFFLLVVFSLFPKKSYSNQFVFNHQSKSIQSPLTETELSHLNAEFSGSGYLRVKGMSLEGFSGPGLLKVYAAFSFMEKVINSNDFKKRVIDFKNKKGERRFESNKGLSNEEIYEIFMEGREVLQMDTPGEANLYLKLYDNPASRVIGYTSSKTNLININWKYFKNFEIHEVSANLTHEWTHKLGFGHTSAREHDSVPYALGYIVRDMVYRAMNQLSSPKGRTHLN